MAPEFFLDTAIRGAAKVLPSSMDSPAAKAMILAICLQESNLEFRRQVGGPARGFAQFEQGGGVTGVFTHPATATHIKTVCAVLSVSPTISGIYAALEHNDILAAACARLLLWTLPNALPVKTDAEGAWQQYLATWRPGKPHRETWDAHYSHAWAVVEDAAKLEQIDADCIEVKNAAIAMVKGLDYLNGTVRTLLIRQGLLNSSA